MTIWGVCQLLKFVDDSKFWGRVDSILEAESLQQDLDTLSRWSEDNNMPFNVGKCKVMHVGKNNMKYDYKLMDKVLESTNE